MFEDETKIEWCAEHDEYYEEDEGCPYCQIDDEHNDYTLNRDNPED